MSWASISDAARLRLELAAQQLDQRRFARARGPDEADLLAGTDDEVEIVEHLEPIGMGELDVLVADGAFAHDERLRARRIDDLVALADELERFGERAQLLEIVEHAVGQFLHAADDLVGEEEDHRERADRDRARERIHARERDEAQEQRERRDRHEGAHHDQEACAAGATHSSRPCRKCEMKRRS